MRSASPLPGPEALKASALRWLAQREHSRSELRARLLRLAAQGVRAAARRGKLSADRRVDHTADPQVEPIADPDADLDADDAARYASPSDDLHGGWAGDAMSYVTALPDDDGTADFAAAGAAGRTGAPAAAAVVDALLAWLEANGYLNEQRFMASRLHVRQPVWGERRIAHELKQHGLTLDEATVRQLRNSELARAQALWARRFGTASDDPAERCRQMRFLAGRGFSTEVIRRVVAGRVPDDE
jgi:regulatory protein